MARNANPGPQLSDKIAAQQFNMTVLQRIDPMIEQILASPGHVALYTMDNGTKAWNRTDVEGSFFLLKRRVEPYFQIFVLNKKSQTNFTEGLFDGIRTELTPPYLYYTNKEDKVVGIWFYEGEKATEMDHLISQLRSPTKLPQPQQAGVNHQRTGSAGPNQSQAQQDAFWDKPATVAAGQADARLQGFASTGQTSAQPGTAANPPGNQLAMLFAKAANTQGIAAPPAPMQAATPPPQPGTPVMATPAPQAPLDSRTATIAGGAVPPMSAAPHPSLLTPSFFQAQRQQVAAANAAKALERPSPTSTPADMMAPAAPTNQRAPAAAPAPENGNALNDLLSRAVRPMREPLQQAPRPPEVKELNPASYQAVATAGKRQQVREAMAALVASDEFIDLVTAKLQASGALH
ncbi:hypothetical protein WJX73_004637 [Symbiochloris irregularis]|uniref:mRNA-decapping enzyme-like protein n=1 Tax=Symbiochloris irregularis TaxID=706552 RepID=A0AAW1NLH1_9CHLO